MATTDEKIISIKIQTDAEVKGISNLQTSLIKLTKERNDLNKKIRDGNKLTDVEKKRLGQLQPELVATRSKLRDMERQVVKNNKALKKNSGFVAGVKKGMMQAGGAIVAMAAGALALGKVLTDMVNIAKDFEQANANLASVLGTSSDKIQALTKDAKRLGAATAFSATEVAQLQTEFAKLGFNEKEILNATEATLSLAAATGSDLAEAAAVAGSTMGGFGLGAEETQRVVDVMAKSFSISALDMEKFRESMKNVAPSAKTVGQTLEETTAQLATLSKAGISGSKAGSNLSTGFINLAAQGLTAKDAFAAMAGKEGLEKLNVAVGLVGKNAAKSFVILSDGQESTKQFTKELGNAGGAAEKMAKEQLNTLEGRLKILNSSWEGFVLGLLSGDSAFSRISKSIVELATNTLGFLSGSVQQVEKDNIDLLHSSTALIDNSIELSSRYDVLSSKTNLTAEETSELDNITNDLIETFGSSVSKINKETGALEINREELIRQIQVRQALQSEQAKALLGEKLQLETQERNLEVVNKRFEYLKKQASNPNSGLGVLSNLINLAGKDSIELSKALLEINNSTTKLTATQQQAVGVITQYSLANSQSEYNQQRIKEIQEELLASGIDLEELTKRSTATIKENGKEDDKDVKRKRIKIGFMQTIEERRKLENELIKEYLQLVKDAELVDDSTTESHLKNSEDRLNARQKEGDALLKQRQKERKDEVKEAVDNQTAINNAKQQAITAGLNIVQEQSDNFFNRRKNQLQKEADLETSILKSKFESGVLTEQEYREQIDEIREKEFESNKKMAIAQNLINAGVAHGVIFAQNGFTPAAFIAGAAVTASTIANNAVVTAQKYEPIAYEEGGLLQGNSHAAGGIPFTVAGKSGFEAEGGEAIINKKSTSMFMPLLSAINQAGGGVSFDNPVSLSKFAVGGLTPDSPSMDLGMGHLVNSMNSRIDRMQVVNVASDTANVANRVNNIESNATFG
jgi:hypothetical protein